jgi:hypothetical protein
MEGSKTNHNKSTFLCFLWKEQNVFFGKVSQRIGAKGLGVGNKWNTRFATFFTQLSTHHVAHKRTSPKFLVYLEGMLPNMFLMHTLEGILIN